MKRPKIGDIIEIPLPKDGCGYAQYTHKDKMYGALLRVFNIREKIKTLDRLTNLDILFTTFFPLSAAVNREIVTIIGNLQLKPEHKDFPIFKAGMTNKDGNVETWWLWDGEKEWKVGKLSKEQESYPRRVTMNDTALIEKILDVSLHS